ncbi:MAG TPA: MBL fold metallo-hydrolase [Myxococcales bacterium]|nr:MBL fold metallo-hydrolase [Myxococcales bacterium]
MLVPPPEETALEVERAAHGLRLRGTQLYLEPIGRPQLGFLSHARGVRAILPERTIATAGTVALLEAAQPRALRKAAPLPAAWGKPFSLGALTLTVHPAGHVLGSAQLRCQWAGTSVVYASDVGGIGPRAPATAEPLEQARCDVLLLRATYGHPRYEFPPRAEVLEDLSRFVAAALAARRTPVILAAPLGGAQEAVRHLGEHELRLHSAPLRFCDVYRAQGVNLPPTLPLGSTKPGQVVVLPAHPRIARLLPDFEPYRLCLLSGRAAEPGFAEQVGVDQALPMSDHAGFSDLLDFALRSGASRVVVVHGQAEELLRALRARGLAAHTLREQHRQLELL